MAHLFNWHLYNLKGFSRETKEAYQARYVKFGLKKGEKVLDVGSGGEPFVKATHLMDLFPGKTQHRYNELQTDRKHFVNASVEAIPFQDRSFDFVYCAHVLEHVPHPQIACEELMRVAAKGYIELPTYTSDFLFNFLHKLDFHRWHITWIGNTLLFFPYVKRERKEVGQILFQFAHAKADNPIKEMLRKHKDLMTTMFLWNRHFTYYVFNEAGEITATNRQ